MHLELAHHDGDAPDGSDPTLPNDQWRFLAGYAQEPASNLFLRLRYHY